MWLALKKLRAPAESVQLIHTFYQGMKAKIHLWLPPGLLERFDVQNGLRQGCCRAQGRPDVRYVSAACWSRTGERYTRRVLFQCCVLVPLRRKIHQTCVMSVLRVGSRSGERYTRRVLCQCCVLVPLRRKIHQMCVMSVLRVGSRSGERYTRRMLCQCCVLVPLRRKIHQTCVMSVLRVGSLSGERYTRRVLCQCCVLVTLRRKIHQTCVMSVLRVGSRSGERYARRVLCQCCVLVPLRRKIYQTCVISVLRVGPAQEKDTPDACYVSAACWSRSGERYTRRVLCQCCVLVPLRRKICQTCVMSVLRVGPAQEIPDVCYGIMAFHTCRSPRN